MRARTRPRLLLLTPPLLQPNAPYPATEHLTGHLRARGYDVWQRDLSIGVVRDVLLACGDETTEELLEFLGGPAPAEEKLAASAAVEDLARRIRDGIDPDFGFARYAERLGVAVADFGEVARRVRRRGVIDGPLERRLAAAMDEIRPDIVGVTCPFPGTLVGAFKVARYVRRRHPGVRLLLGGGYVSTELRELSDPRVSRYFDRVIPDEGYGPLADILDGVPPRAHDDIPAFVEPDYAGIDWNDYFDVVESANGVANLWNAGKWVKLVMARGCYWHRCAFCDVRLPYVGCFRMPDACAIADAMARFAAEGHARFHFVDEAMPPKALDALSRELVRRKVVCEWWGNVRFDAAFTPALARRMARAGCVCVTGGLECANDRLLALMNKGITLASARRVLEAFRAAGIGVHAYLMYGFPSETEREARGALGCVRRLFREGLVQSAFWHRFALTVHSPVAADPARFGIEIEPPPRARRVFARNELAFVERGAPDWDRIGRGLRLATYNYMRGCGLSKPLSFWFT